MEFLERYDSQQLYSSFYFLFGRVEFVVQAAPGPGIISDMMTLSDDLDELDWEFRGSLDDEVQTGWFGKGVTGLYNHSITPKIPTPMTQFHTYAFDWTPERVIWEDDGAVVRTLQASDCVGSANQYPQTPMKLMMGLWDAGDPDHYDPWAAGMTPVPPPEGGYSFYVKSVKIWNNNPAACYNWTDHSGSWQSIKALNDSSACGISPRTSSSIMSSPSATSATASLARTMSSTAASSSSPTIVSTMSSTYPSSKVASSSSATSPSSATTSSLSLSSLSYEMESSLSTTSSSKSLMLSPSTMSSSLTIPSSTSGTSSSQQPSIIATLSSQKPSADASTPLVLSLSASSMKLTSPTLSVSAGASSSMVSYNQAYSSTQVSSTLASVTSLQAIQSSIAQISNTLSPSLHPSSSGPSNTQSPSQQSSTTQRWTTQPASMLSVAQVQDPTDVSTATLSNPFSSSAMPNAVLSSRTSAGQSPRSTTTTQSSSQTSAIIQTLSGKTSTSNPIKLGILTSSTATRLASLTTPGAISAQTQTSSKLVSSTSKARVVASSTGAVGISPTAPPGAFPITTGSLKNSLLHTSATPSQHTLTIVVKLPGHQTLSYNPIIENLTELIYSLERLMQAHMSKRDLTSVTPVPTESMSYSSLSDAPTHRRQHGHQHDHLHDPHRGRGLNNSDHAVLIKDSVSYEASGPFTVLRTNAPATGDEQPAATIAGTSGATSLSEGVIEQPATPKTNAPSLADGPDSPPKIATGETTVPQSFLEDQSAVAASSSVYSGRSLTTKDAEDDDSQSLLQQDSSTASRVSLFGERGPFLRVMAFSLWVFFFEIMYY